jgi:hypothetical protein
MDNLRLSFQSGIKITFLLTLIAIVIHNSKGNNELKSTTPYYTTNIVEIYDTNLQCDTACAERCGQETLINNKLFLLWSCSLNPINKFNCGCTLTNNK